MKGQTDRESSEIDHSVSEWMNASANEGLRSSVAIFNWSVHPKDGAKDWKYSLSRGLKEVEIYRQICQKNQTGVRSSVN